ncbi:MAG TPA: MHYT domain-containing protein [Burkholderiales bacterium]|nr:MHYT domain-containing protein [Burkholderiales bacterium]
MRLDGDGLGIWSMHFIGMLAFHLPIPLAYDVPLTDHVDSTRRVVDALAAIV